MAKFIKERCKAAHHVLISTEGPYENVIKIKPPICFGPEEAGGLLAALADALRALAETAGLKGRLVLESHRQVQAMTAHRSRL